MKLKSAVAVIAALTCAGIGLSGCGWGANVTTMKIRRTPDGDLSISSGKDVAIGGLHASGATKGGVMMTLSLTNYTSTASPEVVKAQRGAETEQMKAMLEMAKEIAQMSTMLMSQQKPPGGLNAAPIAKTPAIAPEGTETNVATNSTYQPESVPRAVPNP